MDPVDAAAQPGTEDQSSESEEEEEEKPEPAEAAPTEPTGEFLLNHRIVLLLCLPINPVPDSYHSSSVRPRLTPAQYSRTVQNCGLKTSFMHSFVIVPFPRECQSVLP